MNRRLFFGFGASSILLAMSATGKAGPAPASEQPERRLARRLTEKLDAGDLRELQAYAEQCGWAKAGLRDLSMLHAQISADFREDRTVMLDQIRISRTEAAWILMKGTV